MTGPNASTASSRLGRSWTCTWDIPSSPYRRSAAASSAGVPRTSRSSGGRPAGIVDRPDERLRRARQRRGVAPDAGTGLVDGRDDRRQLIGQVHARVPFVGQLRGEPEHARAAGPDHDRRSRWPGTAWRDRCVPCPPPGPVEVRLPIVEHRGDDPQALLERVETALERHAERRELGLVPAGAQAEDEPPTADLVERLGHLREQRRVPQRHRRDVGAEPDPRHGDGERREQRHGFPGPAPRDRRVAEPEVVGDPERVEADGLAGLRHGQDVVPARRGAVHRPLDVRQVQAERRSTMRRMLAPRPHAGQSRIRLDRNDARHRGSGPSRGPRARRSCQTRLGRRVRSGSRHGGTASCASGRRAALAAIPSRCRGPYLTPRGTVPLEAPYVTA